MKLYPFQEEAVQLLLQKKKFILAYRMGLGKTIISLRAAEKLNLPTQIIVPAFMRPTWEEELSTRFKLKNVRIDTWGNIRDHGAKVLIADESHYAKTESSQRTKAFMEVVKTPEYVWLLSGTPAKNHAGELYTQLKCVGMNDFQNFTHFANTFANGFKARYGNMLKPTMKYRGVKNVEALRALYAPYMKVLKQSDVSLELPQAIKTKIYSGFSAFNVEDVGEFKSNPENFMTKNFATKKAFQAEMNVSQTVELVKDLKEDFGKVIVFSDHVNSTKKLAKHFCCPFITGEVSVDQRFHLIENFKVYGKVLCCTIGAAGIGLNLQFVNCMVFNDLPWVPGDLEQAEARILRIGQKQNCNYYYVLDPGVGEMIFEVLQSKMKALAQISGA